MCHGQAGGPSERCGEIPWRECWSEQAMGNHDQADQQERDLQKSAGMPPSKEGAGDGEAEQIKAGRSGQLVRLHSLDIDPALDFRSVGQFQMQEDDPVAGHGKREIAVVAAWRDFGGSAEHGGHSGV